MQLKTADVTDSNLAQLGEVTSKGGLIVRFGYRRIDANGRMVDRLVVEQQPRGDRSTVSLRYITEEQATKLFPEQYARFSQARGHVSNGTPLSEIPGITNSHIGRLTLHGLTSVEELLKTSTVALQQIGRDAVKAHEIASDWATGRDLAAEIIDRADVTAELLEQKTALQTERDSLRQKNLELQMRLEAFESIRGGGFEMAASAPDAGERGRIQPDDPDEYGEVDDSDAMFDTGTAVLDADPLAED